jgi:response regulator RpfG family c-di-GMP phosphodiesterase
MPFLYLTAFSDRSSELQLRELGGDDYIVKPVDFRHLPREHYRATGWCGAQRRVVETGGTNRTRPWPL